MLKCLHVLAHALPQMCKAIIRAADRELMTCLCECAQNILNGNVPLTKESFEALAVVPFRCAYTCQEKSTLT